MDALGAYSSDEEEQKQKIEKGPLFNEEHNKIAKAIIQDNSDSAYDSDSSEDEATERVEQDEDVVPEKNEIPKPDRIVPEVKKRKLINPFQAMSSVKPTFLKSDPQPSDDEGSAVHSEKANTLSKSKPTADTAEKIPTPSASMTSKSLLAEASTAVPDSKRKQETVRQKNNRKEKLGQAKFTVKANRDCPDIWRGT